MMLVGRRRAPAASPPMSGRGTADLNARVVLARLECVRARSELIDVLAHDFGFELPELALLVGASTDAFVRWDSKDYPPTAERLDDLADIAAQLLGRSKLEPQLITGWFRSRNCLLDWQRPLDVLRLNGYLRTVEAVDALRHA